jgi:hypothetical protein
MKVKYMSLQMAGHVPRIGRGQGMKKSGYMENTRYERTALSQPSMCVI